MLWFELDGSNNPNTSLANLRDTNLDNGPTLVWRADTLGDGDHHLWVYVSLLARNGSVAVDYFEYVVTLLHFVTIIVPQQDFCFQG